MEPGDGRPQPPSPEGRWERVQHHFHEALELEPAARDVLLTRLAGDDPALAHEVRSLLAAHADASGFLATPPAARFSGGASPGDKIGLYRIVEEIGHGGMGVVYRATCEDDFTKEVAIKLIDPGMRSEEILKRFWAERHSSRASA